MIIPWVAPAFGIFLMRQYILSVPSELLESARIDGASEFRIYWQIVIPLIGPILVTLALLTFLGSWNSYIWPLMVLRGNEVITLPVGLAGMAPSVTGSEIPYGAIMAAATLVSVPIIILFVSFQRYFVAGLTLGAIRE
jgi:ABC-type glycerol-3-phosphate transport system permease component